MARDLNFPALCQSAMELRNRFGYGYKKIGKILGISHQTVRGWFRGSKPFKYAILDPSPDLSYLLGVLFGDGWVTKSSGRTPNLFYRIGLETTNEKFSKSFGRALAGIGLNPLYYYIKGRGRYRTWANNKRFVEWFKNLNLDQVETIVNDNPVDFVRGFYESEGCFYVNPKGGWRIHIYNKRRDLLRLIQRILSKLGVEMKLLQWRGDPNLLYALYSSGEAKVEEFLHLIDPLIKNTHWRLCEHTG